MHRLLKGLWRYQQPDPASLEPSGDAPGPAPAGDRTETRLLTILGQVNEWLQFAEAKNAGLVALDVIALTAVLSVLPSTEVELAEPVAAGLLAAGLLLVVSTAVALWSFIPRSDRRKVVGATRGAPPEASNLFFFGDLCAYQPDQLAAAVAVRYDRAEGYEPGRHPIHVDLASQIVANSRITVAKNAYFRAATVAALLAFAVAVAGVLVELAASRA